MTLENCILAFSAMGEALRCDWGAEGILACCDVYGNAGGDWVGCIAGQYGSEGNICADPLFCGALNPLLPHLLRGDSPCAPEQSADCGLIGAWPVGCAAPQTADEPPHAGGSLHRPPLLTIRPNPCRTETEVGYTIPNGSDLRSVHVTIHDVTGRWVRTLVRGVPAAGAGSVRWRGDDHFGNRVGGGIYYCQIDIGDRRFLCPLVHIR